MKKIALRFASRLKILPVLILAASLAFMVRVGDAALTFKDISGAAIAADESAAKEAPEKKDATSTAPDASAEAAGTQPSSDPLTPSSEAAANITPPSMEGQEAPTDTATETDSPDKKEGAAPAKDKVWEDANDIDPAYSDIKEEIFKDLADRRKQLDVREKAVAGREALLEAGQKELDRKYAELTAMRDEIRSLLKKQSEEEDARLASLVKIYTGMKPKDAARIFNTLDLDVLVDVVGKMPEGKSSPIIAAMDAERARALTMLLAEQKKLPEIPQ